METYIGLIGSTAALLTMFGYLPQVLKMFSTKRASDISLMSILQTDIGCALWLLYGYLNQDFILAGANIVSCTIVSVALILYLRYTKKRLNFNFLRGRPPSSHEKNLEENYVGLSCI
jgi:MtN3 and saliva related transmembrane protein